tara:strand:- start:560 stop:784 length:225 start_codon:yes stop_codon:yes gene_type:complete
MHSTNQEENRVKLIAERALEISGGSKNDLEKFCWMAVHEYKHSVMPVEYDIRDIDEDLYLSVLDFVRKGKDFVD